jgi:pimeloyl-ACP methyl ester carboxylesterase
MWRHQIAALAAAGYHVVAPDQRGYGQTEAPAAEDQYTILHMVGDVIGLLDALGQKQVLQPNPLFLVLLGIYNEDIIFFFYTRRV